MGRIQKGAVNTEVVIDLPGGGNVAAMLSSVGSVALGVSVGAPAARIFKASSVILATTTA